MSFSIRPIEPSDNSAVKELVIDTLNEFGCTGSGYASSDPELDDMYTAYQQPGSAFYVIEDTETGAILGIGGFSRLKGTTVEESICEIQKFYFRPELRRQGMGRKLFILVLQKAQAAGYREAYGETNSKLTSIELCKKMGFSLISSHRGNTGHHHNCPLRVLRSLTDLSDILPVLETATSS